jgi:hypothetical protein
MARKRFLPGFRTAPGPNRSLVLSDNEPNIRFPIRRPNHHDLGRAQRDLGIMRMLARCLRAVHIPEPAHRPEAPTAAQEGWNGLTADIHTWLDQHIEKAPIPRYRHHQTADAAKAAAAKAARHGASTDIAFLEVIPRVLFRQEFHDPNTEIAAMARASVGFIIEWAGLSNDVDPSLAWALAMPKPARHTEVFDDLHFNPKWFAVDDSMGRVGLDPARVGNLREESNRAPQQFDDIRDPLFACPGAHMIPRLHAMAVNRAEAAGLFGLTYLEERARYGYDEARIALDAMRAERESASAGATDL